MNPFLSFLVRTFITLPTTFIIWIISFFAFDETFLLSSGIALAGGALMWLLVSAIMKRRFLKKHGLSRREYRYIKKNLDEAKQKISRLNKTLFSIKQITSLKDRIDILRMVRKIYSMTKREPKRFYEAQTFYFAHLDSVLELTEKFNFLSGQPTKNRELGQSLNETRHLLEEMKTVIENDLYQVISADIEHLNYEMDVAKLSINKPDETRRLK